MDQPGPVERRQRIGDRDEDRHELAGRHRAAQAEPVGQRAARTQLHHEERLATGRGIARVDVEHGDEAGIGDRGHGACLAIEAPGQDGVAREVRQEDLDRDVAVEPVVVRAMDGRHAAGSEERADPVAIGQDVAGRGHAGRGYPMQ